MLEMSCIASVGFDGGLAVSISDCPMRMWSGLLMLLASASAATVVWFRAAIRPRVSPGRTVYLDADAPPATASPTTTPATRSRLDRPWEVLFLAVNICHTSNSSNTNRHDL